MPLVLGFSFLDLNKVLWLSNFPKLEHSFWAVTSVVGYMTMGLSKSDNSVTIAELFLYVQLLKTS